MRRAWFLKDSIAFVSAVVCACCLLVIMISVLRLPEVSPRNKMIWPYRRTIRSIKSRKDATNDGGMGMLGEMMIEMLPDNLAFTVFVPSEKAFERHLRLQMNESLVKENRNDTYAIVSRILGFSAIPRTISSTAVPSDKALSYDSISGFTLYISKDVDGMLLVNRIRSERLDIRRREILVHVMDGVIMDAEFEQSFQPDYGEEG